MANLLDSIIDYLADAVVKDTNGDAKVNNLKLELDTTAQAGTTDGDLYEEIQNHGWESDVIDNSTVNTKKMLTKVSKLLDDEIVYRDFSCESFSFNAGNAGNYAGSQYYDAALDGYEIVGVFLYFVGHAGSYHVMAHTYLDRVYFIFYRVNNISYTLPANDVKARVLYKKINTSSN